VTRGVNFEADRVADVEAQAGAVQCHADAHSQESAGNIEPRK
jgi:hypothetical protein